MHLGWWVMSSALLGAGLWATRRWGQSRWRWLVWPQAALVLVATQLAYLGLLPPALFRWPGVDKALHFALFGAVVFWLNLWLGGRRVRVMDRALPVALLIPLALATTEEVLQGFSPLRSMDVWDWVSDLAGMLLGYALSQRLLQHKPTQPPSSQALRAQRTAIQPLRASRRRTRR